MTHATIIFLAAVLTLLRGQADAFLPVASAPSGCSSRQVLMTMSASPGGGGGGGGGEGGVGLTRAQAVQRGAAAGSGVLGAGVLLGPSAQQAGAEEMKDEVQQFAELRGQVEKKGRDEVSKQNLASLTEATDALKTLDFFIAEKDYQSLRLALRNPPIGNLRASARKVIINIGDKDAEEKATAAYKALITSVDKLDSIANVGMKEKDGLKDDKEISEVYHTCVKRGSELVTLLPTLL
ncbi:unnamed protein product [Pylaiella littoralis]